MNSLINSYKHVMAAIPLAVTASGDLAAIDLTPYHKDVMLTVLCGAVTGTSPTLAVNLQTSANGSTGWTTRATVSLVAGSANLSAEVGVTLPLAEPYVRLSYTAGGTTPSFLVAASLLVQAVRGGGSLNSATPA